MRVAGGPLRAPDEPVPTLAAPEAFQATGLGLDAALPGLLARRHHHRLAGTVLERSYQAAVAGSRRTAQRRVLRLEVTDALLKPRVLLPQALDLAGPRRPDEHRQHPHRDNQLVSHQPPSFTMASNAALSSGMTLRRDCR